MPIRFYFDEMMPRAVARELVKQGYEVIMAVDVEMIDKDDDTEHLIYARDNQYMLVTLDKPFAGRTQQHQNYGGLICWTGSSLYFGAIITKLAEFAQTYSTSDVNGIVFWLK